MSDGWFGLGWWEVGLFFVVGVTLFVLHGYAKAVRILRRMRVRHITSVLIDRSDIPVAERALLLRGEEQLKELGFEFSHATRNRTMWSGGAPHVNVFGYYHAAEAAWAYVNLTPIPETHYPLSIAFVTYWSDDHSAETHGAHAAMSPFAFPNITVTRAELPSMESQWSTHLEVLSQIGDAHGERVHRTSVQEAIDHGVTRLNRAIDDWARTGSIYRAEEDGSWRLTFRAAIDTVKTVAANNRRVAKQVHTPTDAQPIPPSIRAKTFNEIKAQNTAGGMSWVGKLALLVVSVALFAWTFSLHFSWFTVVGFLLALFIHEGGHILGMRVFGYTDLKVLFLPLMGAAAIGARDNVRAEKRAIVSLLGPVPGVVVGLVLLGCANSVDSEHVSKLLVELGALFLALNYINLLPVMPLDGGHVVDELALSGRPFLRTLFQLLGGIVLTGSGLLIGDTVLVFIGGALLVTIPLTHSQGKMHANIRKKLGDSVPSQQEALEAIFETIDNSKQAARPFMEKYQTADQLLDTLTMASASPGTKGLLAGFYAGALVFVPLAALILTAGQ